MTARMEQRVQKLEQASGVNPDGPSTIIVRWLSPGDDADREVVSLAVGGQVLRRMSGEETDAFIARAKATLFPQQDGTNQISMLFAGYDC